MLASVFRRLLHRGILARRRVATTSPLAPRPRLFSTIHVPQGLRPPVQPMALGLGVNTASSVGKSSLGELVRLYGGLHSKFYGWILLSLVGFNIALAVDQHMRRQHEKKAMDGSTMDTSGSSCP